MSGKRRIIDNFSRAKFTIINGIPIDKEIENFIFKLNGRRNIITTNSCAGHSKEEKHADHNYNPYLSFLVNDVGWRIFWSDVLPEISSKIPVIVWVMNENACSILIRAEEFENKEAFWHIVKPTFLKHFNKSL